MAYVSNKGLSGVSFRHMSEGGFVAKPDLPYMTKAEMNRFKAGRTERKISIYRCKKCENPSCNKSIYQSKKYCSKDCFEVVEGSDGKAQP